MGAKERQDLLKQLQHHGQRRQHAHAQLKLETDAIAALLPAALDERVQKTEIANATGLSRPTIDALLKRAPTNTTPRVHTDR